MTVAASTILSRVRRQLVDENVTQHWSDAELLAWLSDAQRAIVVASPSWNEETLTFQLAQGTKQTLPADTHILIDIKRNMGTAGTFPGRAIRVVSREIMDTINPDWHSGALTNVVENFVYDPQQQTTFYVYPPSDGLNKVELSRSKIPATIATVDTNIEVSDIFQTALFDYVMGRAHQKDSDYSAGDNKASMYFGLFTAFLGQQNATQVAEDPNSELGPPSLTTKGGTP